MLNTPLPYISRQKWDRNTGHSSISLQHHYPKFHLHVWPCIFWLWINGCYTVRSGDNRLSGHWTGGTDSRMAHDIIVRIGQLIWCRALFTVFEPQVLAMYFFCFLWQVGKPISSQAPRAIWTNDLMDRDFNFIFNSTQKVKFACTVVMKPAPTHITISVDGAVISSRDSRVANFSSATTEDGIRTVWLEVNKVRGML